MEFGNEHNAAGFAVGDMVKRDGVWAKVITLEPGGVLGVWVVTATDRPARDWHADDCTC